MIGTEFEYKVGGTVRTYKVVEVNELPNLKRHLVSKGFDGKTYIAISEPVGKQKKTLHGLFYRAEANGFQGSYFL